MKLSEFMAAVVPNANAAGEITANRMMLAVDCSTTGNGTDPGDYEIAWVHTENLGAAINPKTADKSYLYEGESTIRTGAQRTFSITGQRYKGDAFQDFVCGHGVVFGTGNAVLRDYVYFNVDTGVGEKGKATISVKKDGAAASGNATDIEVDLYAVGTPAEYTYAAAQGD